MQAGGTPNLRGRRDAAAGRHGAHRGEHLRRRWSAIAGRVLGRLAALPAGRLLLQGLPQPSACSRCWERLFRAMTGLGRVDFATPRLRTPKRYDFCDVLVVGAGPSGLERRAGGGGAGGRDVVLVDENARLAAAASTRRRPPMLHSSSWSTARSAHPRLHRHLRRRLLRRPLGAAGRARPHHQDARPRRRRRDRRLRAAGGVPQQRPARRHARVGGPAPDLPLCGQPGAARRRARRQCRRLRAALDLHRGRHRGGGGGRPARRRPADAARRCCADAASALHAGHCIVEALPPTTAARRRRAHRRRGFAARPAAADRLRRRLHERRLGARRAAALPGRGEDALRRRACSSSSPSSCPTASSPAAGSTASTSLDRRMLDGERAGSAAAAHLRLRRGEGGSRARRDGIADPPLAHRVAHPKGKNFVDFDEDLQLTDFVNAVAGRLRQHRTAEALLHRRHGAEPGQALEHECDAHAGARNRRDAGRRSAPPPRGRSSIRCRCRISPAAASRPSGARRCTPATQRAGAVWMPAGALAAARVLRGRRAIARAVHRGRGAWRCATASA